MADELATAKALQGPQAQGGLEFPRLEEPVWFLFSPLLKCLLSIACVLGILMASSVPPFK